MAKLLLGSVVGPQGPQGSPGVSGPQGPQGVAGPNEIAVTTDVVGLISGQLLYNNGGKVGSVEIVDSFGSTASNKPISARLGTALGESIQEIENDLNVISKKTVDYGEQLGRQVHIYQWGSPYGGNNWCFVRTPDNYSISGAPHELVILNHGNGWVMDGTESMANFSTKTQFGVDTQNDGAYLDTNRADYVQYSSPLIEALLAQGFVVAGAQNDGQRAGAAAGYGNRETRTNIKLFFEHLVQNYNVKNECHMIGASNGAMATLNASFIMREKIRSITLLYPLINLYAAWKAQYNEAINTAYNISVNTFNNFEAQTRGHDPMVAYTDLSIQVNSPTEAVYANAQFYYLAQDATTKDLTFTRVNKMMDASVQNDIGVALGGVRFYRRTTFNFPRIRCHYSLGDTALPQSEHWLAFEELLTRSGIFHFSEEVTGNHGDYTHFEGVDGKGVSRIISWMKL